MNPKRFLRFYSGFFFILSISEFSESSRPLFLKRIVIHDLIWKLCIMVRSLELKIFLYLYNYSSSRMKNFQLSTEVSNIFGL